MRKIFGTTVLSVLIFSSQAAAANVAVITSPPTMLKFVVFGVVVGCIVGSWKLLSILRGGLLFKSWQIIMFGFCVLAVSQVASLLNDFEIFSLPEFIAPALWAVVGGLFLFGIFEAKKTLD